MKRMILIATAMVLAVLAVLAGRVAAQETNVSERTFLTFSGTVELPKLTLQPGTYVFKLADTPSRNVVQVWNQDEKEMLGQWLFVQAERPEVTSETVVMFKETAAGSTPAVQYWYFPGEKIGKEFIYPKDQATKIAVRTGTTVLAADAESSSVSSIDAQGNVTAWQKVEPAASASADSALTNAPTPAQPTAAAGSLAGNRGVKAPAPPDDVDVKARVDLEPRLEPRIADNSSPRPVGTSGLAQNQVARAEQLPQTASPLALSGLIGLLSLAGAMGLRAVRQ